MVRASTLRILSAPPTVETLTEMMPAHGIAVLTGIFAGLTADSTIDPMQYQVSTGMAVALTHTIAAWRHHSKVSAYLGRVAKTRKERADAYIYDGATPKAAHAAMSVAVLAYSAATALSNQVARNYPAIQELLQNTLPFLEYL